MAATRMRMSRTALLPVVFLVVCAVPLATASPWALLVLALPALAAAWVLRVGVDVDDTGLTVRTLVGARTVAWPDLAGVRVAEDSRLWLVTTGGTQVQLPVLRTRDLPRLAAVSGGRIPDPDAPAQ